MKILALPKELTLTAILVGGATLAPLLHSQLVTGTIVNAILFITAAKLGFRFAAAIAVFPSLIALGVGTLPAALAAMVPFIILSNLALAAVFMVILKYNYWLAVAGASLTKFGILAASATVILGAVTHGQISLALSSMMGWPQLITALLGGIAAYSLFRQKKYEFQR